MILIIGVVLCLLSCLPSREQELNYYGWEKEYYQCQN